MLQDRSIPEPNTGCHLWLGPYDKDGYGKIQIQQRMLRAHRVAFALNYGFVPKCVCHACDTPECINPEHLYAGDPATNNRDMVRRGRAYYPGRRAKADNPDGNWKGWPKGVTWASKGLSRKGQGAGVPKKPRKVF